MIFYYRYIDPWASYEMRKMWGLRMRREYRERFPRQRFQRKSLVSDPGMHHSTCATKRSQHSRYMHNMQFHVSDKRHIALKPPYSNWMKFSNELQWLSLMIGHEDSGASDNGKSDMLKAINYFNRFIKIVSILGTLGCVFIDNETHESGVTKCTAGEAWSSFSWHHSSMFHCQWTHNQVFLLLSYMLI